jgi:hypothetical protein
MTDPDEPLDPSYEQSRLLVATFMAQYGAVVRTAPRDPKIAPQQGDLNNAEQIKAEVHDRNDISKVEVQTQDDNDSNWEDCDDEPEKQASRKPNQATWIFLRRMTQTVQRDMKRFGGRRKKNYH